MERQHIERRRTPRQATDAPIDMLSPRAASGSVLDVSSGGLRAAMNRQVEVGQRCLLRVLSKATGDVYRWARVVWCRPTANGCMAGMQFGSG